MYVRKKHTKQKRMLLRSLYNFSSLTPFLQRHRKVVVQLPEDLLPYALLIQELIKEEWNHSPQNETRCAKAGSLGACGMTCACTPNTDEQGVALNTLDELACPKPNVTCITEKKSSCDQGKYGAPSIAIMADTTFTSCCPDEVSAEHLPGVDGIVHFGMDCGIKTSRIPIQYCRRSFSSTFLAKWESVLENELKSVFHTLESSEQTSGDFISNAKDGTASLRILSIVLAAEAYELLPIIRTVANQLADEAKQLGWEFIVGSTTTNETTPEGFDTIRLGALQIPLKASVYFLVDPTLSDGSHVGALHGASERTTISNPESHPLFFLTGLLATHYGVPLHICSVRFPSHVKDEARWESFVSSPTVPSNDGVKSLLPIDELHNTTAKMNRSKPWASHEERVAVKSARSSDAELDPCRRRATQSVYLRAKLRSSLAVGIVVHTLSAVGSNLLIRYLYDVLKRAGKRPYVLYTGRLNVPKLANFTADLDLCVLVGCAYHGVMSCSQSREYPIPVLTPMEVCTGLFVDNYPELNVCMGSEVDPAFLSRTNDDSPLFESAPVPTLPLIPYALRWFRHAYEKLGMSKLEEDTSNVVTGGNCSSQNILSRGNKSSALTVAPALSLSTITRWHSRSYKGLDPQVGQTPVQAEISEGMSGIPSVYDHEKSEETALQ